jgi:ATP-dependent Clp protease adaptor protein ClpS
MSESSAVSPPFHSPPERVFNAGPANPDVLTDSEVEAAEEHDIPWNVVVHNDPINLMEYVAKVFMRVFGFPREKAERHMLEVHQRGRSIVWTGERERAELYVQQLHIYLLMATIEQNR